MGLLTLWLAATIAASPPRASHMHLAVGDLPRSVAFYRDVLGLSLLYQTDQLAAFDAGGFQLLLGPGQLLAPARLKNPNQGVGLAFEVENLEGQKRLLVERGAQPGHIQRPAWGRYFHVQDPDGYLIEYEAVYRGSWRRDIEYVDRRGTSLHLDAFVPEGAGRFPAVIVVHGGGFTGGDRQTFVQPLLELLAGTGRYVVFTISYRLAPKHRFPRAVEDVQEAVRFVREQAGAFQVDEGRLALVGESAGGYLVTMASTRFKPSEQVQAVVAFYGAHDLLARVRQQGRVVGPLRALLGVHKVDARAEGVLRKASPVHWVRPGAPPHLLIHGTDDEQVPFAQAGLMCERLRKLPGECEVFAVEGGGHGMRGWDMDIHKTAYRDRLLEWLDTHVQATSLAPGVALER